MGLYSNLSDICLNAFVDYSIAAVFTQKGLFRALTQSCSLDFIHTILFCFDFSASSLSAHGSLHSKESKEIPDNKSSCFMQINRRLRARCIDQMGVDHIISDLLRRMMKVKLKRVSSMVREWPQLKPVRWALHQINERSLKISPAFSEPHWLILVILDAHCIRPVKPQAERILMQY